MTNKNTNDVMPSSFKEWVIKQYDNDELNALATRGASNGFTGMTYCQETSELYAKYRGEIWQMLTNDSKNMGCESIIEFIDNIVPPKTVHNEETLSNFLVCYAAEKIAFDIIKGGK
jgi:hypothetical protein